MDRIRELRAFIAIVETGSMAAAAGAQKLTPSAMSKLLKRIEDGLGVSLISRTTRSLTLTSEGEAYYEHARLIVDAIDALDSDLAARGGHPSGLLRISCGIAFGLSSLCQVVPEFARRYPDVKVDLQLTDRVVDLVGERIDVAVRIGNLAASSLIQRRIGEMRRTICASPAYLAEAGVPASPEELAGHRIIALSGIADFDHWSFRSAEGIMRRIGVMPTLISDAAAGVLEMGLAGGGIFRLGDNITRPHILAGRLVALLDDVHDPAPVPISLVYPPELKRSPRVRAFVDFLIERFTA
ncbi:MAG: LysR family transcriptional regulator [Hyphomicrobiaceae bacterium]|nr:LysR family transcriptional regulator [Hyphomicrobiaceae bacterium]